MSFLVVAATEAEIPNRLKHHLTHDKRFETLVTGVGMTSTALSLGICLTQKTYAGIINVGIAGAFDFSINLGQPVRIIKDCFGELGVEDKTTFISIDDLGLGSSTYYEQAFEEKNKAIIPIQKVTGITVNTVHGNFNSIQGLLHRMPVQVESMEGAAVFQAAERFKLPCLQLRTISNYVENRNKDKWDIPLALANLNAWFDLFCENLTLD